MERLQIAGRERRSRHQPVVEQPLLVWTQRHLHRQGSQLAGRVRVDGILSSLADFPLEVVTQWSLNRAHKEVIEPAGTAVKSDPHAVDVTRTASGSDGRFASRGRAEGHRHRDRGTGNTGVEAAVISDWEDNPVSDAPVAM